MRENVAKQQGSTTETLSIKKVSVSCFHGNFFIGMENKHK